MKVRTIYYSGYEFHMVVLNAPFHGTELQIQLAECSLWCRCVCVWDVLTAVPIAKCHDHIGPDVFISYLAVRVPSPGQSAPYHPQPHREQSPSAQKLPGRRCCFLPR